MFYQILLVCTQLVIHVFTLTLRTRSSFWRFIYLSSVYTQLMYVSFFLLLLHTANTHFLHSSFSVCTHLIDEFYPLLLCPYAADIHVSSVLYILVCAADVTFLPSCACTQLIYTFLPLLCLYTADVHVPSVLCLYAADIHVSTTAVSIHSWCARSFRLVPIRSWYTCFYHCCVYTQLMCTFLPSCVYTQLIYTFLPLLCLYTADVHVSSFLCLYAADIHVSTTATSTRSWFALFIPIYRVRTQLIQKLPSLLYLQTGNVHVCTMSVCVWTHLM
jgi:hypothetical protein